MRTPFLSEIGKRIRQLREEKGETQASVAKNIGEKLNLNLKRETVNQWENANRDLKTDYIIALADYFEVTSDYILRGVKSENVNINQHTGLSDKAIERLRRFSEEYIESEKLQEIKKKYELYFVEKKKDERITNEDQQTCYDYLEIVPRKNNLTTMVESYH